MEENVRILAVQLDSELFMKLKEYVTENDLTMRGFVSDIIKDKMQSIEVAQKIFRKDWDKEDVKKAIDNFISKNGRVPKQTEFRNENGLPSYCAAGRILEDSPARYAQEKLREMFDMSDGIDGQQENSGMQTIIA